MTKSIYRIPKIFRLLLTAGLLLVFTSHALGATKSCKGLSQSRCSASDNCTWVKGYVTKKGSEVKSYCRTKNAKGKKQSSSSSKGTKKDSKKKTTAEKKSKKTEDDSSDKKKTKEKKKKAKQSSSKGKKEKSSTDKK